MTISAKAGPGDRSRKNTADHATLSSNCSRKRRIGTAVNPIFLQTSQAAIAMAMYKIVHTGPNSQLGGVQRGLLKLAYHGRSAGVVHNDPSPAAPRQTTMHEISRIEDWPSCQPQNAFCNLAIQSLAYSQAISRKSSLTRGCSPIGFKSSILTSGKSPRAPAICRGMSSAT